MYKLYGYVDDERYGYKLVKMIQDEDEYKILKYIDEDIRTNERIYYMIVKRENNTDTYHMGIYCYEDFIDYIDYYRRSHGIRESDKVQERKTKRI